MTAADVTDATYVLALAGEIDLAHAPELDGELKSMVDEGTTRIIVDLLEVPFLESTALGVLLKYSRLLRSNGGELILVTDDVRVMRVIEITGLGEHFHLERTLSETVDNAIEAAYT